MKTALTALFCTVLLFVVFLLGVRVGWHEATKTNYTTPTTAQSSVIIDSSGGNNISVKQDSVNDTSYICRGNRMAQTHRS